MYAAVVTLKNNAMESQTGILMLAVFLLGLSAMAWLTVREASLYESKTALKNLRRNRKSRVPAHEQIPVLSRASLFIKSLIRGRDILDPFQEILNDGASQFENRLRSEIDKLVGKDVYHGQKEQL